MIVTENQARAACEIIFADMASDFFEVYTAADVNAAYRVKARDAHPDAGGSAEQFVQLDRAKHILLGWLKRRKVTTAKATAHAAKCKRCDGTGITSSHKGFRTMRMQCGACRGTGEQDYEHDKGDGL